jgi:hypothetical protein
LTGEAWVELWGEPDAWTGGDDNRPLFTFPGFRINLPVFAPDVPIRTIHVEMRPSLPFAGLVTSIVKRFMPEDEKTVETIARPGGQLPLQVYQSAWLADHPELGDPLDSGEIPGAFVLDLSTSFSHKRLINFGILAIGFH